MTAQIQKAPEARLAYILYQQQARPVGPSYTASQGGKVFLPQPLALHCYQSRIQYAGNGVYRRCRQLRQLPPQGGPITTAF